MTRNFGGLNLAESMTYTTNGQLATVKDANNNVTTYGYDSFDRFLTTTYPNATVDSVAYNPTGTVSQRTTRNNEVFTFLYDELNRQLSKDPPGMSNTVTTTYDKTGLVDLVTTNGTATFNHDCVALKYLSLDPTNRVWAREADSYLPSIALGDVMRGIALGRVEESRHAAFTNGELVTVFLGWEDYSVIEGEALKPLQMDLRIPLSARFALFEHIGSPVYFGLTDIGKIRPGDHVVVTAAAGAVGSLAVQMARNLGAARVVGVAGSDEKCGWLTSELGADAAVNYRRGRLRDELRAACPHGIDLFFDNVGGEGLEIALDLLNMHGRIVICGAIGGYEADGAQPGPRNLLNLVFKRARMEGFVCFDYVADTTAWARMEADITRWHLAGQLRYRVDLVDGLEHAPAAVNRLFDGSNRGKLVVRVSDDT